jgi:hypothetical protein
LAVAVVVAVNRFYERFLSRSEQVSTTRLWYRASEIKFTQRQVIWILENLTLFREGMYPSNPGSGGYTDTPYTRGRKAGARHAPFEHACDIAAEVEVRLKRTGLDGFLLEAIHCWGKDETEMAGVMGMNLTAVFKRTDNALRYIAGWRRKPYSYKEFVGHKKVRVAGRGVT